MNLGRWAFGETHYLDDATGERVYSMRHIEAELSAFGEACRRCSALRRCPGVSRQYARRYGVDELVPFTSATAPNAPKTRANSFNYVRTETTVPWTAEADACTAHARSGGLDPVRQLWLVEGDRLTRYVTDTGDFTAAEIARVKSEWSHLFVDRARAGRSRRLQERHAAGPSRPRLRLVCEPRRVRAAVPRRRRRAVRARGGVDRRPHRPPARARARRRLRRAALPRRARGVVALGCDRLHRASTPTRRVSPDSAPRCRKLGCSVGDIEHFDGEPASYDHVLCLRALNHVLDLDEALSRMSRLLKPGGSLLLVEMTPFAMLRRAEQVAAADRAPRAGHQHFRNLASEDVLPFVGRHGLRVVEHHPATRETSNQWILLLAIERDTLDSRDAGMNRGEESRRFGILLLPRLRGAFVGSAIRYGSRRANRVAGVPARHVLDVCGSARRRRSAIYWSATQAERSTACATSPPIVQRAELKRGATACADQPGFAYHYDDLVRYVDGHSGSGAIPVDLVSPARGVYDRASHRASKPTA